MPTPPAITSPPTLGQNIRLAREAAGLTQLALAHAMGRTGEDAGAYISRLENDCHPPKLDTLGRIAEVLEVGVDRLILGMGTVKGGKK